MQNQRPIRASLPAITRENQLRLGKLMKTQERVWRRGWDWDLRAVNAPVFDDSDRRNVGENDGSGTFGNLDSLNVLVSVVYDGGEGGIRIISVHPQSEAMHITERYRRRDFGHMDIEITMNDPKMYTKPFTIKVTHVLHPESDVLEYVCAENEKDRAHTGLK
jgi:hypothetical protein